MKKLLLTLLVLWCVSDAGYSQSLADIVKGVKDSPKDEKGDEKKESKKRYDQVITKHARSSRGVMSVHMVGSTIYLEIPLKLMQRDMLLASRVSQTSDNTDVIAGQMPVNPLHIRWSADDEKVYLHNVISNGVCDPSESIVSGFERNNIAPIMKVFPIKAINRDSTAVVIDVTKYFSSDEKPLSPFIPSGPFDGLFGIKRIKGTFKGDMSSVLGGKAFPENVNIKSRLVFTVSEEPFTAIVTTSMILLPEKPMMPRYDDDRVGYFTDRKLLYSENKDVAEKVNYINRWRLNPRPEDVEKHRRGELVVPEKQIVYYVDSAFPAKWRQWIKEGIEDWQMAFEKIGFKDAIIAKDFPTNDPNFDPEDIRNSCITYASTTVANAMGPSWTDPRSGEILQGSVYFYHNVLKLLHDWRFVQTSTVDPKARLEVFEMETMGPLLRYLIAHEIGHTIGLMHNMRGSYAYPVDSLRSPSFTKEFGTTASIMDYARYNFVAQPGDNVTQLLPPRIGLYDFHAIRWGYAPIYEASTPEAERPVLNKWLVEKADNPIYRFGPQQILGSTDPASLSESLGDDAVKASKYGIENLKIIAKNLPEWTAKQGRNYNYTKEMHDELFRQLNRYIGHCMVYIGGNYLDQVVAGDGRKAFEAVPKAKQREALGFIFEQIKDFPNWFITPELSALFEPENDIISQYQVGILRNLISPTNLGKVGYTAKLSGDPYTQEEYLTDLYNHVWATTIKGKNPDWYERQMEYSYIHSLMGALNMYQPEVSASKSVTALDKLLRDEIELSCKYIDFTPETIERALTASTKESDLKVNAKTVYFAQMNDLEKLLRSRRNHGSKEVRNHYRYLHHELVKALNK